MNSVATQNLLNTDSEWSATEYAREVGLWSIEAGLVAEYFPPPPAHILDIGCGAGRTSAGLRDLGYRVTAIDLSRSLLAIAASRHADIDFRLMDAGALDFADGTFDGALFSYNGIDYIYPEAARLKSMAETRRVLRTNAPYIFSSHSALGAVCCAGPWFLLGHIKSAAFLSGQLLNPHVCEWYFRYRDGGGPLLLHSAPPSRTIRQLESVGFSLLCVCGDDGRRNPPLRQLSTRYHHVHFAARRS